jgi:isopenicillin N synthase-like dioxygenase
MIPKISLKDLSSNNKSTISLLSEALTNHGFFVITDHEIPFSLFNRAYEYSEKFFNLESSIKYKYSFREHAGARGYTPFGKETALGESVPDLKEFWHHGPIIDNTFDTRIMDNIVVNEIKDFNKVFDELFKEMNNLGSKLLSAISVSLDLPNNYFA